jgi:hypothetical protein
MQAENQNFSDFFLRTEQLADKLGIRAVDLPDVIGISKAMLFAYRKGKYPISWRAWKKLESAELCAGIGRDENQTIEDDTSNNERDSPQSPQSSPPICQVASICEFQAESRTAFAAILAEIAASEARIAAMIAEMRAQFPPA